MYNLITTFFSYIVCVVVVVKNKIIFRVVLLHFMHHKCISGSDADLVFFRTCAFYSTVTSCVMMFESLYVDEKIRMIMMKSCSNTLNHSHEKGGSKETFHLFFIHYIFLPTLDFNCELMPLICHDDANLVSNLMLTSFLTQPGKFKVGFHVSISFLS